MHTPNILFVKELYDKRNISRKYNTRYPSSMYISNYCRAVYRFTTTRADPFMLVLLRLSVLNIPVSDIKITPSVVDHLQAGCLRRPLQGHRVDHETPRRSERSVQRSSSPDSTSFSPDGHCILGDAAYPVPDTGSRPLPWDLPITEPRRLQLLPVLVQDGRRTGVRYSGEVSIF